MNMTTADWYLLFLIAIVNLNVVELSNAPKIHVIGSTVLIAVALIGFIRSELSQ